MVFQVDFVVIIPSMAKLYNCLVWIMIFLQVEHQIKSIKSHLISYLSLG